MKHVPVLLTEAVNGLFVQPGKWYIDATLGAGGHTREILAQGGKVLAIDQDEEAIELVRQELSHPHLVLVQDNFSNLTEIITAQGISEVQGILFDLGMSSMQIDDRSRGFSFLDSANLDMRMDRSLTVTARDLINGLGVKELKKLFRLYGDEPRAKQISMAIVTRRKQEPIETTKQLADLVSEVYHYRRGKLHPATKVFQALRIAVNDEMNALKSVLPQAVTTLTSGGRLVVISFHSGEDAIVKHSIREQVDKGILLEITDTPITPSQQEISNNIRSRSAKLRIAEKI